VTAPTFVYCNAPVGAWQALLALGTPKLMLVTATHTPDQDANDFINDASANEAAGTGYTAGGITLTSVTVTLDTATNTVKVDAADISGISVSCRWAIAYVDTGTPSTSRLLSCTDLSEGLGGDVTATGITWSTDGIFEAVVA
jgi:hypothetical protein